MFKNSWEFYKNDKVIVNSIFQLSNFHSTEKKNIEKSCVPHALMHFSIEFIFAAFNIDFKYMLQFKRSSFNEKKSRTFWLKNGTTGLNKQCVETKWSKEWHRFQVNSDDRKRERKPRAPRRWSIKKQNNQWQSRYYQSNCIEFLFSSWCSFSSVLCIVMLYNIKYSQPHYDSIVCRVWMISLEQVNFIH